MKKFSLIVAYTRNSLGIGFKNDLPWPSIIEDLRHFENTTTLTENPKLKNCVIMGRRTFESINKKPLKNRHNLVLTSNVDNIFDIDKLDTSIIICSSLEEAINHPICLISEKIFIVGGSNIYKEAMDHEFCDKLYITEVDKDFECDTFFPKIPNNFKVIEEKKIFNENIKADLIFKTFQNILS